MQVTIILTITRSGRVGKTVADWFHDYAKGNAAGFDVELVDLEEVNLPLFDESRHPARQQYEHKHTRRWSEIIDRSDAFIFVLPEYNYTAPRPSLMRSTICTRSGITNRPAS